MESLTILFIFGDKVSLPSSPGWPETRYVDQAAPELKEFLLLLPPECWD